MIRCLVPDLPDSASLVPWLRRIDENRWYTNSGPLVLEFEKRLLDFLDGGRGATCTVLASGMSALELGVKALGIDAGKRVLLPALTFPATALAVARCGAMMLFGDVCPDSWVLTPAIARSILERERIDLVMPVAAFGLPLPSAEWDAFTDETKVPVLADAAGALGVQSLGTRVHWAFSLHATKPMGIGEGGLFVSLDSRLTESTRRLANFGFVQDLVPLADGTNAKLTEYAAAVGLVQLERWPQLLVRRRAVLKAYRDGLASMPDVQMQSGPDVPPAMLCVKLPADARVVAEGLARAGTETRRWYLPPLYEHPAFGMARKISADGKAGLPVTEALATSLLGLPFHTSLSAQDVAHVVRTISEELSHCRLNQGS